MELQNKQSKQPTSVDKPFPTACLNLISSEDGTFSSGGGEVPRDKTSISVFKKNELLPKAFCCLQAPFNKKKSSSQKSKRLFWIKMETNGLFANEEQEAVTTACTPGLTFLRSFVAGKANLCSQLPASLVHRNYFRRNFISSACFSTSLDKSRLCNRV